MVCIARTQHSIYMRTICAMCTLVRRRSWYARVQFAFCTQEFFDICKIFADSLENVLICFKF